MPTDVDATLGRRIEYEMKRRGWSYGDLAKRMAEAGCPVQKIALHRVVNGNPKGGRRRLTASEMVALAEVFGVSLSTDLLTPIELLEQKAAQELIATMEEITSLLGRVTTRMLNTYKEYFELKLTNPELGEYVEHHWFKRVEDGIPIKRVVSRVDERGTEIDYDDSEVAKAVEEFMLNMVRIAGEDHISDVEQHATANAPKRRRKTKEKVS